ncbi:MAG: SPW repeat protein [Rhodanobacteraceae bacterium]
MANYEIAAQRRNASGLNVLIGCWLIASPWIFGYTGNISAFWNSIGAGALIAILAASCLASRRGIVWSSWWNVLLGLWAIASPWIYGYAFNHMAMWDCVAVGIAVTLLATYRGSATPVEHPGTPTPTATH